MKIVTIWLAAGLIAVAGCTATVEPSSDVTSAEGATSTTQDDAAEWGLSDLFSEEGFEDLRSLQQAIDLAIEDQVVVCMREEGFEYIPESPHGPYDYDMETSVFRYATNALSGVDLYWDTASSAVSPPPTSPNDPLVEALPPAEQDAWSEAVGNCFDDVSEVYHNPLADDDDWFAAVDGEASERAAADPAVIEAFATADRCFQEKGFGDYDTASNDFYERVSAIQTGLADGEMSRDEGVEKLQLIAGEELEASRAFWSCREPAAELWQSVFNENLRTLAEEQQDEAALWAAEISKEIEQYRDYLNKLRTDE